MHHIKILFSLAIFFITTQVSAQTILSERDKEIIRYDATSFIKEFELLLNTIASPKLSRL
ncbi:MAG: hypothetical protein AAGI07_05280 [Bacteroidota bacterium]